MSLLFVDFQTTENPTAKDVEEIVDRLTIHGVEPNGPTGAFIVAASGAEIVDGVVEDFAAMAADVVAAGGDF